MKRLLENARNFFERITGRTVEPPPVAPPVAPIKPKSEQPPPMFSVLTDADLKIIDPAAYKAKKLARENEQNQTAANIALESSQPPPIQVTPPPQRTNILKALLNRNRPEVQNVAAPKIEKAPAPPEEPLFGSKFLQGLGNYPNFDDSEHEDESSEDEHEHIPMMGEMKAEKQNSEVDDHVIQISSSKQDSTENEGIRKIVIDPDNEKDSSEDEHEQHGQNNINAERSDSTENEGIRKIVIDPDNEKDSSEDEHEQHGQNNINAERSDSTENDGIRKIVIDPDNEKDSSEDEHEQHGQNNFDAERDGKIQLRSKLQDEIIKSNPNIIDRAALKEGITALKTSGVYDQLKTRGNKMNDAVAKIAIDKIDRLDTLLKRVESKIVPPQGKRMIAEQISHLVTNMKTDNTTIEKLKSISKVEPSQQQTASFRR